MLHCCNVTLLKCYNVTVKVVMLHCYNEGGYVTMKVVMLHCQAVQPLGTYIFVSPLVANSICEPFCLFFSFLSFTQPSCLFFSFLSFIQCFYLLFSFLSFFLQIFLSSTSLLSFLQCFCLFSSVSVFS